jgi:hypothetical protein
VRTDANGIYTFAGIATSLGHAPAAVAGDLPGTEGGHLRFAVRGDARRVQVTLLALSGSLIREVADARLQDGEYRVRPFRAGMAPGNYLLRIRIGGENRTLKLAYLDGIGSAGPGLMRTGPSGSASALAKTAAASIKREKFPAFIEKYKGTGKWARRLWEALEGHSRWASLMGVPDGRP